MHTTARPLGFVPMIALHPSARPPLLQQYRTPRRAAMLNTAMPLFDARVCGAVYISRPSQRKARSASASIAVGVPPVRSCEVLEAEHAGGAQQQQQQQQQQSLPPRSPVKTKTAKVCVPTLEDALDDVQVNKSKKLFNLGMSWLVFEFPRQMRCPGSLSQMVSPTPALPMTEQIESNRWINRPITYFPDGKKCF